MAHIRQSKPDSGLGVREKVLETTQVVAALLGSGPATKRRLFVASLARTPYPSFRQDVFSARTSYSLVNPSIGGSRAETSGCREG